LVTTTNLHKGIHILNQKARIRIAGKQQNKHRMTIRKLGNRVGSERFSLSVHMRNFSPVDRDEIQRNKIVPQTVILLNPVTYIKPIHILLKWKYIQSKTDYSILAKLCVKKVLFWPCGLKYSHAYGKILLSFSLLPKFR